MYQFETEQEAVQAAWLLAINRAVPIRVMRSSTNVWTIGPFNPRLPMNGRHVATVHTTGRVEHEYSMKVA